LPVPTAIVCTPSQAMNQPGAVEMGVLLSFLVVALYLLGFYESMLALPEVSVGRNWAAHMGENLNIANDEWTETQELSLVAATEEAPAAINVASSVSPASPAVDIPAAQWPISIRNENNFETILHPGDNVTEMSVPRFWSAPVHNKGHMSRETAMQIGSCIEPDEHGK